jgi:hypothetical protein
MEDVMTQRDDKLVEEGRTGRLDPLPLRKRWPPPAGWYNFHDTHIDEPPVVLDPGDPTTAPFGIPFVNHREAWTDEQRSKTRSSRGWLYAQNPYMISLEEKAQIKTPDDAWEFRKYVEAQGYDSIAVTTQVLVGPQQQEEIKIWVFDENTVAILESRYCCGFRDAMQRLLGTTQAEFPVDEFPNDDALLRNILTPQEEFWSPPPGADVIESYVPLDEGRIEMIRGALLWAQWVEVEEQYAGGWSYVSSKSYSQQVLTASFNPETFRLMFTKTSLPEALHSEFEGPGSYDEEWETTRMFSGVEVSIQTVTPDWSSSAALAYRPRYLDVIAELGVRYFASGANSPGDMRGFLETGHNVGASGPEFVKAVGEPIRETTWETIQSLAYNPTYADRHLFLDSGAFSEVDKKLKLKELKHISDEGWVERLGIYHYAAELLGPRVHVVLPDRLGWQHKTLTRQRRHAARIRAIRDLGAQLLLPLPRGWAKKEVPHPLADQFALSCNMLDISPDELVPSIPTAKFPVRPHEAAEFLLDLRERYGLEIGRIHLLGSGPTTAFGMAKITRYVDALRAVNPDILVSCDSAEKRRLATREPLYKETKAEAEEFLEWAATFQVVPWGYSMDPDYWDDWIGRIERGRVFRFLKEDVGLSLTAADKRDYLDGFDPNEVWLRGLLNDLFFSRGQYKTSSVQDQAVNKAAARSIEAFIQQLWEVRTQPGSHLVTDWVHEKAIVFTAAKVRSLQDTGGSEPAARRVLVITSCTGRKDGPAPAEELYTGDQHVALMAGVEAARERGFDIDVWIVSAGLGVVHGSTVCDSYNITFSGESQATIRRRARALNIPADVAELLAGEYDLALVLLGRDYLIASDLGNVSEFGGGPVRVAVAPSALGLLPDDPHIFPELIDKARAARLRGQIRAKGEWAQEFLHDLEPW